MPASSVRSWVVAVVAFVIAAPLLAQIPLPPLPRLPKPPGLPAPPRPPHVVPLPPLPELDIHISTVAPPPRPRERMSHRPSAEHVWIGGMWHWRVDHWIWIAGRWERPHGYGVLWVAPRYVREGRHWRYEPGHWSDQQMREGDDYRRFKEDQGHGRGRGNNRGHGHDRDKRHGHD